jgi:hypothetical protein
MSYWTCEFDVSHLISSYPRINKFHPTFFTKFRVLFFRSDHSIISTSTNSTFYGSRDSFTKQSISVYWFYNEKYRALSPLQLSPHLVGFCWPKPLFVEETLIQFEVVDAVDHRIEILIHSADSSQIQGDHREVPEPKPINILGSEQSKRFWGILRIRYCSSLAQDQQE